VPQSDCYGVAQRGDGSGLSWQAVLGRRRWHCAHAGSGKLADPTPRVGRGRHGRSDTAPPWAPRRRTDLGRQAPHICGRTWTRARPAHRYVREVRRWAPSNATRDPRHDGRHGSLSRRLAGVPHGIERARPATERGGPPDVGSAAPAAEAKRCQGVVVRLWTVSPSSRGATSVWSKCHRRRATARPRFAAAVRYVWRAQPRT